MPIIPINAYVLLFVNYFWDIYLRSYVLCPYTYTLFFMIQHVYLNKSRINFIASHQTDINTYLSITAGLLAKAIRSCFHKLIEDIHCDEHAPFLFGKRALSTDEYEKVRAAVGSKSKVFAVIFHKINSICLEVYLIIKYCLYMM